MINTIKKETVSKAQKLLQVIEERKQLEKIEKELKEEFKNLLGDGISEVAINADGILISLDERERTSLDKKALSAVIDLKPFEKVTSYKVMSVKKVG